MDKLNIALELIVKSYKEDLDVSKVFDFVDKIEDEAIKRFLYIPKVCPKCASPINMIDLHGAYRAKCDCSQAQGETLGEATYKWWEKVK